MKKLIIAAAIVCAAVMSQAAVLAWGSYSNLVDANGNMALTDMGYNYVLVFNGSVVDTATFDVVPGEYNDISSGYTLADGMKNGDIFKVMAQDKTTGDLYDLVYYGTTDVIESYTLTGMEKEPPNPADFYFGQTGDFTVQSVPEPTSGLLLLLGVAGLALRRRRA